MSQKQWGHGYYKGVEAAQKNSKGLVGLLVHTIKDGKIECQLSVDREFPGNNFLLTYYSFIDGYPNGSKIFSFDELKDCIFYDDEVEWRRAHHNQLSKEPGHKNSFEECERIRKCY